jgi:hypothetical protein
MRKCRTNKSENFMKFIQYIPDASLFLLSAIIRGGPASGGDNHHTSAGNREAIGESASRLNYFYPRRRQAW